MTPQTLSVLWKVASGGRRCWEQVVGVGEMTVVSFFFLLCNAWEEPSTDAYLGQCDPD